MQLGAEDQGLTLTREIENELSHQEEELRQVAALRSQQMCLWPRHH